MHFVHNSFRIAIEQNLNQLSKLPEQISTAQMQVETFRIEAKQNFVQVVKLLQELLHLSQVSEELRTLAEQHSRTLMEITPKQVSLFSAKVYSWEESTISSAKQIETLTSSLDPFRIISTIKDLVEIKLSEYIGATVTIFRELEESQKKYMKPRVNYSSN